MYSYTTNWLNVEVNWNYTHRCSFRTSTLSILELLWGDRNHMSDIFWQHQSRGQWTINKIENMCSKLHSKRKYLFIRYQSKGSKWPFLHIKILFKILYSMECLKTDFDVRWSKTSAATMHIILLGTILNLHVWTIN